MNEAFTLSPLSSWTSILLVIESKSLSFSVNSDQDLYFTIFFSHDSINFDTYKLDKIFANKTYNLLINPPAKWFKVFFNNKTISIANIRLNIFNYSQTYETKTQKLEKTSFGELIAQESRVYSPYKWSNSEYTAGTQPFSNIHTGFRDIEYNSDDLTQCGGSISSNGLFEHNAPNNLATWSRIMGRPILYQSATAMSIRFTTLFNKGNNVDIDENYIGAGNLTNETTKIPRNFIGVGNYGSTNGIDGAEWGIFYIRGGTTQFFPKNQWNINPCPWLDPTKAQIWEISLGYLGFAPIIFKVYHKDEFIEVHRLDFANSSTITNLSDPSLRFIMQINRTTPVGTWTQADKVHGNASYGCLLYNDYISTDFNAYNNEVSILAATETPIIMIHNPSQWFSKTNSVLVSPLLLSIATDGTKSTQINIYAGNSSIVSGASWTNIDANYTPIQYTTVGTLAGGKKIFSISLAKVDNVQIDMSQFSILANGSNAWVITAISAGASDAAASITWKEIH